MENIIRIRLLFWVLRSGLGEEIILKKSEGYLEATSTANRTFSIHSSYLDLRINNYSSSVNLSYDDIDFLQMLVPPKFTLKIHNKGSCVLPLLYRNNLNNMTSTLILDSGKTVRIYAQSFGAKTISEMASPSQVSFPVQTQTVSLGDLEYQYLFAEEGEAYEVSLLCLLFAGDLMKDLSFSVLLEPDVNSSPDLSKVSQKYYDQVY